MNLIGTRKDDMSRPNSHSVAPATPVVRLWLAVLAGYLALGATIQAIPGYVTDDLGAGTFGSSLAVGIAFLATAAVRPIAGLLADTRDPGRSSCSVAS